MLNYKWFAGSWGLYKHKTISPITSWDSILELGVDYSSVVTQYPVEQGGFTSVNKISKPSVVKVQLVKTLGILPDIISSQVTARYYSTNETLKDLERYRESGDLIDIESPHGGFIGYSLAEFSCIFTASQTAYMLVADLTLQEVREVAGKVNKYNELNIFGNQTPVSRVQGEEVDASSLRYDSSVARIR